MPCRGCFDLTNAALPWLKIFVSKKKAITEVAPKTRWRSKFKRRLMRVLTYLIVFYFVMILLFSVLHPPTTLYMISEGRRLGASVDYQWVNIEEVSPKAIRSIVAAEDANFCLHWGFDMAAIRDAIDGGGARGASSISQQMVKNLYFWQGRSWVRKGLEAITTPLVEMFWSKRRILEVYLNIIEFDEGVFGIDAASHHYFKRSPEKLSKSQAANLAVVLPNPKNRNPNKPSARMVKKAAQAADGAATILADGRSACFEVESR